MIFHKTKIKDVYIIEPELVDDERGYFGRFFCKKEFEGQRLNFEIVQINRSLINKKGTIKGLHFQKWPKAEVKIVQCLKGKIFDVAVDLRKDSATYGQWVRVELTQDNKKMFLIPKGCAHGFQSLKKDSEILYFISEFYSPENESGVRYDDPFLNIKWPIENPSLSERDKKWPLIQK
ncbi:MAG: dTDP-4-dehydrorhamnose 3,5-epimerase [Candidatus Staskawiczbacteria bacterium]|nr:dTDP-4-dehydrorhamnose 3,5-epimerase [Candidatus Staskawiczbacteria bacterium]